VRAATLALASFVGPLVYNELRTQQQLGYIVSGGAGNEGRAQFAYFIIQSGDYPADELESRADKVIGELPARLLALDDAQWQTIVAGVRAKLEEKDKSIGERARRLFELAYEFDADWARTEATNDALSGLTRQATAALLGSALSSDKARNRVFLGFARDLRPRTPPAVSFSDPRAWKAGQRYE
jgi:secreted Zn-dependent insulinase-like peptidase